MKRKKGFFSKLKKSTIITIASCGSFVGATFLALLLLVRFPVTPPEKMTASLGRRSTYNVNSTFSATSAVTETSTTESATTVQTTTALTTHTDYVITVTMGKGFTTRDNYSTSGYTPDYDTEYDGYASQTTTESQEEDDDYAYNGEDYYDNNYYDDYYSY